MRKEVVEVVQDDEENLGYAVEHNRKGAAAHAKGGCPVRDEECEVAGDCDENNRDCSNAERPERCGKLQLGIDPGGPVPCTTAAVPRCY